MNVNEQSSRNGPQLSAAIDALAIALFEVRGLAYGLPRNWHALLDSEQGDYRGMAIDVIRQMKPKAHETDLAEHLFQTGVAMNRILAAGYRARVIGAIAPDGGE